MPFVAPEGTELVAAVGQGTVFDVAIVRDVGDSRHLERVCKRLTSRALREPAGRAAIVREAKCLALVKHPALPALVRVGTDGHGPFLLETRAEGVSIAELVEGWRYRGGRVPERLVAHVAFATVEALAELQELADASGPLGFVHGDLGPDDVLLGPLGQPRLVDLGAARWRDMEKELATADRGTLPFVPPEVARGEAPPSAGADVYALAATLLHLATGKPICAATEPASMLLEIGERGIAPERVAEASLPAASRAAIGRALDRDPSRRFATARQLLGALAP